MILCDNKIEYFFNAMNKSYKLQLQRSIGFAHFNFLQFGLCKNYFVKIGNLNFQPTFCFLHAVIKKETSVF